MDEIDFTASSLSTPKPKWVLSAVNPTTPITSIGAWCYNRRYDQISSVPNHLSLGIDEFVEFADGKRLTIGYSRGLTIGWDGDQISEEDVLYNVNMALLPDEADRRDRRKTRPWHEYSDFLKNYGYSISPSTLKKLPYITEFSPELETLVGKESTK